MNRSPSEFGDGDEAETPCAIGYLARAEEVFRADLMRNRRSGRSLFGLVEALKRQHKDYALTLVQKEFETAWQRADTKLSIEGL